MVNLFTSTCQIFRKQKILQGHDVQTTKKFNKSSNSESKLLKILFSGLKNLVFGTLSSCLKLKSKLFIIIPLTFSANSLISFLSEILLNLSQSENYLSQYQARLEFIMLHLIFFHLYDENKSNQSNSNKLSQSKICTCYAISLYFDIEPECMPC